MQKMPFGCVIAHIQWRQSSSISDPRHKWSPPALVVWTLIINLNLEHSYSCTKRNPYYFDSLQPCLASKIIGKYYQLLCYVKELCSVVRCVVAGNRILRVWKQQEKNHLTQKLILLISTVRNIRRICVLILEQKE